QTDVRLALDGQQLPVAPEVPRATLDQLARERAPDAVVVVLHLEGAEARLADVQRCDGALGAALATLEPFGVAHEPMLLCVETCWGEAPQAGQVHRGETATRRQVPVHMSIVTSRPANIASVPASSRRVSAACSVPASTTAGPRTPAS